MLKLLSVPSPVQVDQRHLHAFLHHEGVCIELELSMPDYRDRHQKLFDELLDSVALVDHPGTEETRNE